MPVPGRNRTLFRCVCITAFEADQSCSFPGSLAVVGFSPKAKTYMREPYSLIHVVSSDDPGQMLKTNVELLFRLPLPSLTTDNVSAISRMCLSFMHQR